MEDDTSNEAEIADETGKDGELYSTNTSVNEDINYKYLTTEFIESERKHTTSECASESAAAIILSSDLSHPKRMKSICSVSDLVDEKEVIKDEMKSTTDDSMESVDKVNSPTTRDSINELEIHENDSADVVKSHKKDSVDEVKISKKILQPRTIVLKRVRHLRRQSKRIKRFTAGKDNESHETAVDAQNDEVEDPFLTVTCKPELMKVTKEMHNGVLYRIGDIITMTGGDDLKYYAQLKYFLSNQFCERFVAIRWLLPNSTLPAPSNEVKEEFNPDLFCQGPDQIEPVNMDSISFVMHLPNVYYFDKDIHYHREEHGLVCMSLPTSDTRPLVQLISTKTGTSV